MVSLELDVRGLPKPDRHPAIFAAYQYLPVGAAFVLVNNDDPRHLREEFEADFAGSYGWEFLQAGPRVWRSSPTNRPSRRTDLRHNHGRPNVVRTELLKNRTPLLSPVTASPRVRRSWPPSSLCCSPWGTSAPDSRRAAVMILADELFCYPWRYGARAISMSRRRTREREPWLGLNPSPVLTQRTVKGGSPHDS
jgi:uncharacterized protein (DUF2249 family)